MYPRSNIKNQWQTPPRASVAGPTGTVGAICAVPVSAAGSGYINLQILLTPPGTYSAISAAQSQQIGTTVGVVGNYVTIYAEGSDIGVVVGPTSASVSAPSLTKYGSVGATGVYTGVTGSCQRIPAGAERRWLLQESQDLFLGFIGAGTPGVTGIMRIYQSNPPGI